MYSLWQMNLVVCMFCIYSRWLQSRYLIVFKKKRIVFPEKNSYPWRKLARKSLKHPTNFSPAENVLNNSCSLTSLGDLSLKLVGMEDYKKTYRFGIYFEFIVSKYVIIIIQKPPPTPCRICPPILNVSETNLNCISIPAGYIHYLN